MKSSSPLLYNATIASAAVSAAFELGLFERLLQAKEGIEAADFCREKNLDSTSFLSIIYAMECFDIVRNENGILKRGDAFEEFNKDQGYFHWMIKGYRDFLGNFRKLLNAEERKGKFFERDGAAIALSGKHYGDKYVDRYVRDWLSREKIKKVADLGCGSAHRLLQMTEWAGCDGIGVEIDAGGIHVAEEAVRKAGKANISIIQGDVTQLEPRSEFVEVDLISSFFMGHDLWPRDRCIQVFQSLRRAFPNVRRFIFCDTFQSKLNPQKELPTFTLGFEVFHAMMAQYIPTLEEWRALFSEGGWICETEIVTEIPFTHIFILKPT